jgi:hypothetical protein
MTSAKAQHHKRATIRRAAKQAPRSRTVQASESQHYAGTVQSSHKARIYPKETWPCTRPFSGKTDAKTTARMMRQFDHEAALLKRPLEEATGSGN